MSLQQTIKSQIVEAMKAKDSVRLETLRGLSAAITNELVALKRKPTDELSADEVLGVIRRAVKQRKEAFEQFSSAGRVDLADKEKSELTILESYLPQMMSKDEVVQIAKLKLEELDALNIANGDVGRPAPAGLAGKLMSLLMKDLKGKADGTVVKQVVDEILS